MVVVVVEVMVVNDGYGSFGFSGLVALVPLTVTGGGRGVGGATSLTMQISAASSKVKKIGLS